METAKPIAKLRSVFGAFSHAPPEPSRRDVEAQEKARAEQNAYVAEQLPASPVYHQKTGVLLIPSKRFDGSTDDPPWNIPEPILWDWLRTTKIEHIEERCLSGVGGVFWARYRNYDGQLRSALLRFGGVSREASLGPLGAEYSLEGPYDLLKREQASYESMKALGCEDIAPPVAARETNLVPLISDATREKVGREMKVPPILVDETFGICGLLQALPLNAENFAEYWAKLGPDDVNRWERASDRLRHSIYRWVILDFVLGVPNRLLCDHLYSESSDSLSLYNFEVSFPHPGMTAEWYLQVRKAGWGKKFSGPLEEPSSGAPAGGADSLSMIGTFPERSREEIVLTAKQMVKGFDERVATLLIQSLVEIGVPVANISSLISRLVFLEKDPEGIVDSFRYVRSVLVPLRRGYGLEDGTIQFVSQTTSQAMTGALGEEFDFAAVVQEPAPEGLQLPI